MAIGLHIQGMSTCAVQEIVNLSYHKTPKEAMERFCNQTLGKKGDCRPNEGYSAYDSYKVGGNQGSYTEGLGENYIFHGVVSGGYGNTGDYTSKFAAFITDNKLGSVAGGEKVANHRYHPDHKTIVFIWNPDREAVKKWWLLNSPVIVAKATISINDPVNKAAAPQAKPVKQEKEKQ